MKHHIMTLDDGTFRTVVALDREVSGSQFVCELDEESQDKILEAVVFYLQSVGLTDLELYKAIVNAMSSRIKDLTECLSLVTLAKAPQDAAAKDKDHYIFAEKRWSTLDIAEILKEEGFEPSWDNINEVLNQPILEALNDCTDQDWQIISDAVYDARKNLK